MVPTPGRIVYYYPCNDTLNTNGQGFVPAIVIQGFNGGAHLNLYTFSVTEALGGDERSPIRFSAPSKMQLEEWGSFEEFTRKGSYGQGYWDWPPKYEAPVIPFDKGTEPERA
jgi:hypothetical protein